MRSQAPKTPGVPELSSSTGRARTPRGRDRERLVRALAEYLLELEQRAEDLDDLRRLP